MMKKNYLRPYVEVMAFNFDGVMQCLPGASQIDNDGDGIPEQHGNGSERIIPGDPDGGIGAKPNTPWDNADLDVWGN